MQSTGAFARRQGGTCGHPGCTTTPCFGVVGSNKREFCVKHAKQGTISEMRKTCDHRGCTTIPSFFGVIGSNKKDFCSKHAKQGMINLIDTPESRYMCGGLLITFVKFHLVTRVVFVGF